MLHIRALGAHACLGPMHGAKGLQQLLQRALPLARQAPQNPLLARRTTQEVYQLRARGLVRGGTVDSAIVGYGHDWYELAPVRFYEDEPARHLLVDLTVRA